MHCRLLPVVGAISVLVAPVTAGVVSAQAGGPFAVPGVHDLSLAPAATVPTSADSRQQPPYEKGRWTIGAELSWSKYANLEGEACDATAIPGLDDCRVKDSGAGWGVYGEYKVRPFLSVGARYTRSSYSVDQDYGATTYFHDVTVNSYDIYALPRLPSTGRTSFFGKFGGSWMCNRSDIRLGGNSIEVRRQGGLRLNAGLGMDIGLTDQIGGRATAEITAGKSGDVDSRTTVGVGIRYSF